MNNRDYFNSEANEQRNRWLHADSQLEEKSHSLSSSSPFIIKIVNGALDASVNNVDVGASFTNRTASNFGQNSNITITSSINGVSYLEWLAQTEQTPFTVGATMVISSSAGQLDYPMQVIHKNANGDQDAFALTPTPDPYQSQTDRVVDFTEYLFDGGTKIRFRTINQGATVTLRLYAKESFNPTQIAADRDPLKNWSNPGIIRAIPTFEVQ